MTASPRPGRPQGSGNNYGSNVEADDDMHRFLVIRIVCTVVSEVISCIVFTSNAAIAMYVFYPLKCKNRRKAGLSQAFIAHVCMSVEEQGRWRWRGEGWRGAWGEGGFRIVCFKVEIILPIVNDLFAGHLLLTCQAASVCPYLSFLLPGNLRICLCLSFSPLISGDLSICLHLTIYLCLSVLLYGFSVYLAIHSYSLMSV